MHIYQPVGFSSELAPCLDRRRPVGEAQVPEVFKLNKSPVDQKVPAIHRSVPPPIFDVMEKRSVTLDNNA